MNRILLTGLLWVGLGAALYSQPQPPLETEDSFATLYIYQKGSFGRSLFDIWINDQLAAQDFKARSYFIVKVPVGTLRLRTTGRPAYFVEEKNFRLQVYSGQEYYLEAILDYDFMSSSLYLVERKAEDFHNRKNGLKLNESAKTTLE